MKNALMAAALLALAACGGTSGQKAPGLQKDGTIHAQILLQGDSPGFYESVLVGIAEVEVKADGRILRTDVAKGTQDLARAGGVLLTTFDVPAGVAEVEIAVRFDRYGGFQYAGGSAGELRAATHELRYAAQSQWLAERGHAVFHFDLARSLVPDTAGRIAFMPQLEVRF